MDGAHASFQVSLDKFD